MKYIITLLFVFIAVQLQAQDYIETIAKETCDCIDKVPKKIKGDKRTMRLGLCIMEAAGPYKKNFKKDYGLNFGDRADQRAIGKMIGEKMAMHCPDAILAMISDKQVKEIMDEVDENTDTEALVETTGKVLNIENDNFVVFEIKNNSINSSKYYLLNKIETDIKDFNNSFYNLVGKDVIITFEKVELFDANINDYRNFKIIKSIAIK